MIEGMGLYIDEYERTHIIPDGLLPSKDTRIGTRHISLITDGMRVRLTHVPEGVRDIYLALSGGNIEAYTDGRGIGTAVRRERARASLESARAGQLYMTPGLSEYGPDVRHATLAEDPAYAGRFIEVMDDAATAFLLRDGYVMVCAYGPYIPEAISFRRGAEGGGLVMTEDDGWLMKGNSVVITESSYGMPIHMPRLSERLRAQALLVPLDMNAGTFLARADFVKPDGRAYMSRNIYLGIDTYEWNMGLLAD